MARQHIKDLRIFRKLSQAALGKAVGLTAAEVSRVECGYRDLSEAEAVAIAKALDVVPGKIDPRLLKPIAPAGLAVTSANADGAGGGGPAAQRVKPSASLEEDPANFREMPEASLLERGAADDGEFRARLQEALKRAQQVLHTPKVPAATWRAWREFERQAQARLRQ